MTEKDKQLIEQAWKEKDHQSINVLIRKAESIEAVVKLQARERYLFHMEEFWCDNL